MKYCTCARHEGPNPLPLSEFGNDSRRADGVSNRCRACVAAKLARWERERDRHRPGRSRRRRQANPEKFREGERRRYAAAREKVFGHYGRVCRCCGTTENLSIDHVNGDGTEHRLQLFGRNDKAGAPFYRWLAKNGFPDGFQTLCMPCNTSKKNGDRCRLDHAGAGGSGGV
jgi:hypothetical protein